MIRHAALILLLTALPGLAQAPAATPAPPPEPPEQPVELHNAEYPGRPYKPGKSMRRVLIAAWGTDASVYVGRKITLYGDPTIRFGKDAVGGIRIRALSHIPEPLTVALTVTRGKRAPFTAPDHSSTWRLGAAGFGTG